MEKVIVLNEKEEKLIRTLLISYIWKNYSDEQNKEAQFLYDKIKLSKRIKNVKSIPTETDMLSRTECGNTL